MPEGPGLNRRQWEEKLAAIGEHLRQHNAPATLEIIGAWPVIEAGLEGRTSLHLDIWMPASELDRSALAAACAAAGLDFDPTGETDRPYLQLVQPGIVAIPDQVPVKAGRWGALTIITPPPAALAAMKLVRAEPKDIADVLFLCSRHGLGREQVAEYVRRIPDVQKRRAAEENLVVSRRADREGVAGLGAACFAARNVDAQLSKEDTPGLRARLRRRRGQEKGFAPHPPKGSVPA